MQRIAACIIGLFCLGLALPAAAGDKFELTAKLVDIPSKFPPDDLYDYAFVMKYEVTDGTLKGQTIYVAHYKPRQKRKKIKDKMKDFVSGKLKKFKVGDSHKMTLDPALDKIWQGAVVDDYFATDRKSTRYWCLKVDPA
jgi:hypothetical protein